jgi:glutaredoxin 3
MFSNHYRMAGLYTAAGAVHPTVSAPNFQRMKPVKIYTTTYCGFCTRAKEYLGRKGVAYEEIDVTGDDEARERLVEMADGRRTVPQIFIGDRAIGGYTDLVSLDKNGALDPLLRD